MEGLREKQPLVPQRRPMLLWTFVVAIGALLMAPAMSLMGWERAGWIALSVFYGALLAFAGTWVFMLIRTKGRITGRDNAMVMALVVCAVVIRIAWAAILD